MLATKATNFADTAFCSGLNGRTRVCPSRCGTLELGNLAKLRSVANMINKLRVRCRHANAEDGARPEPKHVRQRLRARSGPAGGNPDIGTGCTWVGVFEDRDAHEREECGYTEVACRCEGCSVRVQRLELAEHEGACERREVTCEKCSAKTKAGELEAHRLFCKMVEVECPENCGAKVLRGKLRAHEEECADVVVRCSFAQHGCEVRAERRKIGEHEAEAVMAHCKLAAGRAERLEKEKQELEQAVKRLEAELMQAPKPGRACVTWRIERFVKRAIKKQTIKSRSFRVSTHCAVYRLKLEMEFIRAPGSRSAGYVGIFFSHVLRSQDDGCITGNFPVDLRGSEIAVVKNGQATPVLTFNDDTLDSTQEYVLEYESTFGNWAILKTDRVPGLMWTERDEEADPDDCKEAIAGDVMDFLEDGVLTFTASVQLTPPKTLAI